MVAFTAIPPEEIEHIIPSIRHQKLDKHEPFSWEKKLPASVPNTSLPLNPSQWLTEAEQHGDSWRMSLLVGAAARLFTSFQYQNIIYHF